MKIKIQIKSWLGKLLFELEEENNTLKKTLETAVLSDAVLSGADLRGADLSGADLSGADLRDADLRDAVLSGADLRGADLSGADLSDADLRGAVLRDAVLSGAVLRDADLRDAVLSGAVLSDADLRDAVSIEKVKEDFYKVLNLAPAEVEGLLQKLREGKVNGSVYQGDCCCLVGTIANVKGCDYTSIPGLIPNASRPAERFFYSIREGHTPENRRRCKEIEGWILEWMELNKTLI